MEAGAAFHQDPKHATDRPRDHAVRDARRIGSGWVAFAGSYLMITGLFNLIWGVTALSKKSYFVEGGLVWSDLNLWGWLAIVVAVVQFTVGGLLFARKVAGMLMALVVAMCGIVLNFLSIGAYPVWSSIAIVGSCLVLWAVTVHSDEFASG
jgi:NADH:ubiquinone oxidoreductase subunit K